MFAFLLQIFLVIKMARKKHVTLEETNKIIQKLAQRNSTLEMSIELRRDHRTI